MYYIIKEDNTVYQVSFGEFCSKIRHIDCISISNINRCKSHILLQNDVALSIYVYTYWRYADDIERHMKKIQDLQIKIDRIQFIKYMEMVVHDSVIPLDLQLLTTKETNMTGAWIYPDIEFVYNR